ncbi:Ff.00g011890.m01.CDS01 [Fusarium sp. VM40]|nr:Ff.00g011890.m01.CDS01 [Fusarium sp. VM40]
MKLTSFLGALATVEAVNAGESVYVVNSRKGNEVSSGFAYYADNKVSPWGRRPDDYTDVTHGSLRVWEGKRTTGRFSSGVSFYVDINADAYQQGYNAWVGGGNNGFKQFTCHKTHDRAVVVPTLYTVDGWTVQGIYWCREYVGGK